MSVGIYLFLIKVASLFQLQVRSSWSEVNLWLSVSDCRGFHHSLDGREGAESRAGGRGEAASSNPLPCSCPARLTSLLKVTRWNTSSLGSGGNMLSADVFEAQGAAEGTNKTRQQGRLLTRCPCSAAVFCPRCVPAPGDVKARDRPRADEGGN